LLNPATETIEVLQNDPNQPASQHGNKDSFSSGCLPGLTFRCTEIFAR